MLSWSILQYFWPALSHNWSWKPIFGLFESGSFKQIFTVPLSKTQTCKKNKQINCWCYNFEFYLCRFFTNTFFINDIHIKSDMFRINFVTCNHINTFTASGKCTWKCRLLLFFLLHHIKFNLPAYSIDPDQTAPYGAVWSGSPLFAIKAFEIQWQTTKWTTLGRKWKC